MGTKDVRSVRENTLVLMLRDRGAQVEERLS